MSKSMSRFTLTKSSTRAVPPVESSKNKILKSSLFDTPLAISVALPALEVPWKEIVPLKPPFDPALAISVALPALEVPWKEIVPLFTTPLSPDPPLATNVALPAFELSLNELPPPLVPVGAPLAVRFALPAVELSAKRIPSPKPFPDPPLAINVALPAVEVAWNSMRPPRLRVWFPPLAIRVALPAFEVSLKETVALVKPIPDGLPPSAVIVTLLPTVALFVNSMAPP